MERGGRRSPAASRSSIARLPVPPARCWKRATAGASSYIPSRIRWSACGRNGIDCSSPAMPTCFSHATTGSGSGGDTLATTSVSASSLCAMARAGWWGWRRVAPRHDPEGTISTSGVRGRGLSRFLIVKRTQAREIRAALLDAVSVSISPGRRWICTVCLKARAPSPPYSNWRRGRCTGTCTSPRKSRMYALRWS